MSLNDSSRQMALGHVRLLCHEPVFHQIEDRNVLYWRHSVENVEGGVEGEVSDLRIVAEVVAIFLGLQETCRLLPLSGSRAIEHTESCCEYRFVANRPRQLKWHVPGMICRQIDHQEPGIAVGGHTIAPV